MPTRLPDDLVAHDSIAEMDVGAESWTVPWAMMVDEQQGCWLNGRYATYAAPGGTATMKVRRAFIGYFVTVPDGYTYAPTRGIPWQGATHDDLLSIEGFDDTATT